MIKLEVEGIDAAEQLVHDTVRIWLNVVKFLPALWKKIGSGIKEHFLTRWMQPQDSGIAPLASSTLLAKRKRWGYYKQSPGAPPQGSEPFNFWWTGLAADQATSEKAWHAVGDDTMVYDFGPDTAERKRLGFMHLGGKNRPARSLYDIAVIDALIQKTTEDFLGPVLEKFGGSYAISGGVP